MSLCVSDETARETKSCQSPRLLSRPHQFVKGVAARVGLSVLCVRKYRLSIRVNMYMNYERCCSRLCDSSALCYQYTYTYKHAAFDVYRVHIISLIIRPHLAHPATVVARQSVVCRCVVSMTRCLLPASHRQPSPSCDA